MWNSVRMTWTSHKKVRRNQDKLRPHSNFVNSC